MQESGEITIRVSRGMIFRTMGLLLFIGSMVTLNSIDNPRLHGVRGPDVLRLMAIGWCAGLLFALLMLLIHGVRGVIVEKRQAD